MKTKEIDIPDGYEFTEVKDGKIILTKKQSLLPKSWAECFIPASMDYPAQSETWTENAVPKELSRAVTAFHKLLVCRNRWWELLEWSPDWEDNEERKFCICMEKGKPQVGVYRDISHPLAFPTLETRNEFLSTFRALIEEAKSLL